MAGQSWTHHNIGRLISFLRGLYLESGFYTFDPLINGSSNPVKAYCNYDARVSAESVSDFPDQGQIALNPSAIDPELIISGETLNSGFVSRSFRQFTYNDWVNAQSTEENYIDSVLDLIFKNEQDMNTDIGRYKAMVSVSPSVFSGKMQIFVQAQYSCKNSNIRPLFTAPGLPPSLVWNGVTLSPVASGLGSTHLMTDEGGDYYIVQTGGAALTMRKLTFPPAAQALHNAIKNGAFGPDENLATLRTRAEAYLFTSAKLHPDTTSVSIAGVQTGYILYYAWHWVTSGKEGYAVRNTQELKPGETNIYLNVFKLCKLQITQDIHGVFSCVESVEEAGSTGLLPWFNLCYPDTDFGKLKNASYANFNVPSLNIPPYHVYSEVPVYCYVDREDNLHVLRINSSLISRTDTVAYTDNGPFCWPNVRKTRDDKTYNGINGTVSAQLDELNLSGEWLSTSGEYLSNNVVVGGFTEPPQNWRTSNQFVAATLCNGQTWVDWAQAEGRMDAVYNGRTTGGTVDLRPLCNTPAQTVYYAMRLRNGILEKRAVQYPNGRSIAYYVTAVIPFSDCSSVVLVDKYRVNARQRIDYIKSVTQGAAIDIGTAYTDCFGTNIGEQSGTMFFLLSGNLGSDGPPVSSTEPASFSEKCYVHVNGTSNEKASNSGGLTGGEFPGTIGNYDYFYFGFDDVFIEHPDLIKQSVNGGWSGVVSYVSTVSDIGDGEYPGAVSVGWA